MRFILQDTFCFPDKPIVIQALKRWNLTADDFACTLYHSLQVIAGLLSGRPKRSSQRKCRNAFYYAPIKLDQNCIKTPLNKDHSKKNLNFIYLDIQIHLQLFIAKFSTTMIFLECFHFPVSIIFRSSLNFH